MSFAVKMLLLFGFCAAVILSFIWWDNKRMNAVAEASRAEVKAAVAAETTKQEKLRADEAAKAQKALETTGAELRSAKAEIEASQKTAANVLAQLGGVVRNINDLRRVLDSTRRDLNAAPNDPGPRPDDSRPGETVGVPSLAQTEQLLSACYKDLTKVTVADVQNKAELELTEKKREACVKSFDSVREIIGRKP